MQNSTRYSRAPVSDQVDRVALDSFSSPPRRRLCHGHWIAEIVVTVVKISHAITKVERREHHADVFGQMPMRQNIRVMRYCHVLVDDLNVRLLHCRCTRGTAVEQLAVKQTYQVI